MAALYQKACTGDAKERQAGSHEEACDPNRVFTTATASMAAGVTRFRRGGKCMARSGGSISEADAFTLVKSRLILGQRMSVRRPSG
jgi:hypothetical protein